MNSYLCAAAAAVGIGLSSASAAPPSWTGQGTHRLLVRVPPVDIDHRAHDAMPAEIVLDMKSILHAAGIDGAKADLASLQVIRYDASTGDPMGIDEGYLYGRSPNDRPFAWYDNAVPYDFPQILGAITRTRGELNRANRIRAGYVYNVIGDWDAGHLAWVHTQDGDSPSNYAVYFNLLPKGAEPPRQAPRGWVGDAMPRAEKWGTVSSVGDHTSITLDDWDDDGLTDIIYGEQYGCVFVLPNRGTAREPKFPFAKMIKDADGVPIDVGLHAAPLVTDWDGDGVKDLLCGVYENRVALFLNKGTNRDRKLVYQKFIHTADGEELKLPIRPIVGRSEDIFKEDYNPVIDRADWNGDGKPDLLAGGYVTGRIFFFENVGRNADGSPRLEPRGPIEADGKPINVGDWCAAPCAVDLNGDGKLDLVSGCFPMTPESKKAGVLLRYYENVGSASQPVLQERPFPRSGEFPHGGLAVPRACDFDGDGVTDLIVGAREDIFLFRNTGTRTEPRFNVAVKPLPSEWGNASLPTRQFIDSNKDGWPDYVEGYDVHLNSKAGNPFEFRQVVQVVPPGVRIAHPSGVGDDWFWPYLCDFDQDGKVDVLFGDWHGTIWFHRNIGSDKNEFDATGYRLKLTDGSDLKVGPINGDTGKDFVALQGARTVFTVADFDGDGLDDLAVGDTYGKIRCFRNAGTRRSPVFDPPVDVGDVKIRMHLDSTDWNGDGKPDIVAGVVSHFVRIFFNTAQNGKLSFDQGNDPGLPPIMEPGAVVVDMNRDGDQDLFLTSTQGSMLAERSFLKHGYAKGELIRLESRSAIGKGKP